MSTEQDKRLSTWAGSPLPDTIFKPPPGLDIAPMRQSIRQLDRALKEADRCRDLEGVFENLLASYEMTFIYYDYHYNWGGQDHQTKIEVKAKDSAPDLGIQKGAGFLTFVDCLTFAAQCFLSGEEGFGLPLDREIIETDIDTWLRREERPQGQHFHRVLLTKTKEGIILEAQRGYDHSPVLQVIGGSFMNNLQEFNSHILDEEVLRIAEDVDFMFVNGENPEDRKSVV